MVLKQKKVVSLHREKVEEIALLYAAVRQALEKVSLAESVHLGALYGFSCEKK